MSMSSSASLIARWWMLGVLASAPVGAAEPPARPSESPAATAKAPVAAKAPAAAKTPATAKAPASKSPGYMPVPVGGKCTAPEPDDPAGSNRSCGPQTVSDLAIASMEDEEDYKPAPLPFTWDVPRALQVIPMSDVIEANGFPVRLSAVLSAERPEVILQHMVDRFQAAGFYIPPVETQPQMLREPQLTALDPMGLISYTFILQPNGNGTTTVILGETQVGKRKKPAASDIAPVMNGAKGLMQSRQEAARLLGYSVSVPLSEVKDFYAKQLGATGYQETEPGVWRKGSDELSVTLRPGEGGQTSVLIIRRSGAAAPPTGRVVD